MPSVKFSKQHLLSFGALILVLLVLPLSIFIIKREQRYQSGAEGPESVPLAVKISNLHGGGFSVSWKTETATNGSIKFGTSESLTNEGMDDRGDILSTTHHVTITNQNPNTAYYFKIKSGPTIYGKATGDVWLASAPAVSQNTPAEIQPLAPPNPIFGNIKNQSGTKIENALVYVYFQKAGGEKSALLSTITNPGWVIDTKNARTENLQSLLPVAEGDRIIISVEAAENGVGQAEIAAGSCITNGCEAFQDIIVSVPQATSTPTTPLATNTPTIPVATSTPTTPQATSTPTTPIEPGATTLSLKVRFQGIADNRANEKKISVILKQEGVEKYAFPEVDITSDTNGVYTTANLTLASFAPGTYDIFVKGWCHLTKEFNSNLNTGENILGFTGQNDELLAGDANGNDRVDGFDFNALINQYMPNPPGSADFNLSGRVDGFDFLYIVRNYFQE